MALSIATVYNYTEYHYAECGILFVAMLSVVMPIVMEPETMLLSIPNANHFWA
jgi:hypothetical protein